MAATDILVVLWQWGPESKYAGGRFWAAHNTDIDGKVADWPRDHLIPLGAAQVTVVEGAGLDLLPPIADRTIALGKEKGWR
jgi:hypothetical protein